MKIMPVLPAITVRDPANLLNAVVTSTCLASSIIEGKLLKPNDWRNVFKRASIFF